MQLLHLQLLQLLQVLRVVLQNVRPRSKQPYIAGSGKSYASVLELSLLACAPGRWLLAFVGVVVPPDHKAFVGVVVPLLLQVLLLQLLLLLLQEACLGSVRVLLQLPHTQRGGGSWFRLQ